MLKFKEINFKYTDAEEERLYSPELISFIKNKTKWGAAFRFGHLKIPAEDFKTISDAMGAKTACQENSL